MMAFHWMYYLNQTGDLHIQHKLNRGDGWDPAIDTVSMSRSTDEAIVTDMMTLESNGACRPTIMDQEKFNTVKYMQGKDKVTMEFNEPQF